MAKSHGLRHRIKRCSHFPLAVGRIKHARSKILSSVCDQFVTFFNQSHTCGWLKVNGVMASEKPAHRENETFSEELEHLYLAHRKRLIIHFLLNHALRHNVAIEPGHDAVY